MKNNILSVDWAFHKTGFAYYDSDNNIIIVRVFEIRDKYKIKYWDQEFYIDYLCILKNEVSRFGEINQYVVEIGYGKADKMSLFYAWFYNFWLRQSRNVVFVNPNSWICETLGITNINQVEKGQDKQLIKEYFQKYFEIVDDITQDEIDAVMMLVWKYPKLKGKKIVRKEKIVI